MLKCSQTTFTLGASLSRTERAGGIAMLGRRDYISRFQYQNDEQYVEWAAVRYAVDIEDSHWSEVRVWHHSCE